MSNSSSAGARRRRHAGSTGIVSRLASQRGTGQEANVEVAARCVDKPDLLGAVAVALEDKNARIAGDAAEVMTKEHERPGVRKAARSLLKKTLAG